MAQLTAHVMELLAPLGPVSTRRMFGAAGLFHRDMMFGLIARDEVFFKAGDSNRRDFEAAGEAPFSYATRNGTHTIRSYWRCPPELLDEPESFLAWARKALDAAAAAELAKPGARRKSAAKSGRDE
jgi:DNA transformation protein